MERRGAADLVMGVKQLRPRPGVQQRGQGIGIAPEHSDVEGSLTDAVRVRKGAAASEDGLDAFCVVLLGEGEDAVVRRTVGRHAVCGC